MGVLMTDPSDDSVVYLGRAKRAHSRGYTTLCEGLPGFFEFVECGARCAQLLDRRRRIRTKLFFQLQHDWKVFDRRCFQQWNRRAPINRSVVRRQMLVLFAVVVV